MAQFNSYPTKATPIAADTVLIYDSAGAVLKQVPIKNLFENYAGSSLGGSAQSVKSAIDALNSNCIRIKRATQGINLRPNSDVTGDVVTVVPADAYVFVTFYSSIVDHVLYYNNGIYYSGYCYSANLASF